MYPSSFDYAAPTSVADAVAMLAAQGEDAKVLAGGHSLLPLMKLRFLQPSTLVDLRRIPALAGIRREGESLVIGAMTTHADIGASPLVRDVLPILAEAAVQIGDPQVRNRGTIGGSLAHADPGADLPAVMLATEATIVAADRTGTRAIAAGEFFVDILTSALAPGELLTEVRIPIPGARTGGSYAKHAHPASRYAIVGVAAVIALEGGGDRIREARVAVTGLGTKAGRAVGAEALLTGQRADLQTLQEAADHVADGITPREDLQGDAEYKTQLARVIAERALLQAAERAR
jgi:aerobic carbon-monoxide dehydrogenase medium subunit